MALHGGGAYYDLKKSFSEETIFDLSISINPYDLPFDATTFVSSKFLKHYPDTVHEELNAILAQREGAQPQEILTTSGASEGINAIVAFLKVGQKSGTVLIVGPVYSGYALVLDAFHVPSQEVRMSEDSDFSFDVESIIAQIESTKPSALFICNPCNPTGRLLNNSGMKIIEQSCQKTETLLVIDESYRWLCSDSNPYPSGDGTIVLKSLTKEYGIPGLRMGFLRGKKELIDKLRPFILHWSMSVPAVLIASRALAMKEEFETQWKKLNAEAIKFMFKLKEIGFDVHKSESPFFLAKMRHASILAVRALKKGLILRECTSFGLTNTIRFGTCVDYPAVIGILEGVLSDGWEQ